MSAQSWQQEYELYTRHQQLYFFAFIVAVVAEIKYIDIEFENQPVTLPLFGHDFMRSDIVGELINVGDVARERDAAKMYENSLIPPLSVSECSRRRTETRRWRSSPGTRGRSVCC